MNTQTLLDPKPFSLSFLLAQQVKNLSATQEMQVLSLGRRGGNGNTLQYTCLENPMDRGAWGAPGYTVVLLTKSKT